MTARAPGGANGGTGGLLVVLAHPDDETFACGGTIVQHLRAGVPVTCVCATLGQMGRNTGRPPLASRESLPALRERELRAACAVLGVTDLRLLRLFDKTVEFADPAGLAARIGEVLSETRPSIVITFHPEHGGHPDHDAVGAATLRAVAALPEDRRPEVRAVVHPLRAERLAVPLERVDVTSVADVKLAALRAHRSQTQAWLERLEDGSDDPRRRLLVEERFVVLRP